MPCGSEMPLYYFFYAGFAGDVPPAEIRSILRLHHYHFQVIKTAGRLEVLEIHPPLNFNVLDASAFKNIAGEVLCMKEVPSLDQQALESLVQQVDWGSLMTNKEGGTWSVRVKGNRSFFPSKLLKRTELELAAKIKEVFPLPVNLNQADAQFQLVIEKRSLTTTLLCFGLLRHKQSREIRQRLSRTLALRRPYFSIGTMNNPVARAVANLSETPPGKIILDPFCGSGGILIEAALNGNYCLGLDINRIVIRGARQNLKYFAPDMRLGEIRASAFALPLRCPRACITTEIGGVSTDLPYGHSISTQGLDGMTIWDLFLNELKGFLLPGTKCCMVVPNSPAVDDFLKKIARESYYKVVDTCIQVVHESLTRRFIVLEVP